MAYLDPHPVAVVHWSIRQVSLPHLCWSGRALVSLGLQGGLKTSPRQASFFFFSRPPGHKLQTFCIHSFMPSASIQPLGWWCTTTPGGNFSFGWVFHLKMTIGFNFVPSARQERTTVKQDFSWPVVLIVNVFSPRVATVLADGMSNQTGEGQDCGVPEILCTSCWMPGSRWCSVHQSSQAPWYGSFLLLLPLLLFLPPHCHRCLLHLMTNFEFHPLSRLYSSLCFSPLFCTPPPSPCQCPLYLTSYFDFPPPCSLCFSSLCFFPLAISPPPLSSLKWILADKGLL